MKFWQKAFFLTLVLFLIAINAIGYILLERSYTLNKEYAIQAAQAEFQIIERSVFERIDHLSTQFTQLNQHNLRGMILPYADFYSGQRAYLALFLDGIEVFNSNPYFSPDAAHGKVAFVYYESGLLFCIVGNEQEHPFSNLRLVYMRDISSLLEYRNDMVDIFIRISVAVSLILAVALLFMLVHLTQPFRKLGTVARSIAQGDYDNRAPIRGRDEVGEFARSFNLMADRVQEHVDTLTEMSENRERFINDLSHEVKTPITAIMGYAELLGIGNIRAEERKKSIDYIINQSLRIKGMTSKLADLACLSHGNIDRKPVDIAAIIENAQASCNAQLEGKQLTLSKDIGEVGIIGDAALLESLIQNLIENATKYSESGGRIDIVAYSEDGKSVITVSDSGRGIEENDLAKITEPFFRVDTSRSRADGGVGLGLALCARICEIHDAQFTIDSKLGVGTKISIYFTTL